MKRLTDSEIDREHVDAKMEVYASGECGSLKSIAISNLIIIELLQRLLEKEK